MADRKKEVYDEDLITLANDVLGKTTATYNLDYFNIISGNTAVPTATIRITKEEETIEEASTGDGPVDAIFKAIERATGIETNLKEYHVQSVTSGKQALGEVSVILIIENFPYKGKGSSTDILEASAKAFINALNRYTLMKREA